MINDRPPLDWSDDLLDSLWFHVAHYLSIEDIDRLSRTCSHLHGLFTDNDFWSHLIRVRFGTAIWRRFVKTLSLHTQDQPCRSKQIYNELIQRHSISFADFDQLLLDTHRNYTTIADPSSLHGHVLYIHDSVQFAYSLHIELQFKDILPGRYDVIWRMKLNLPYMLGDTEFLAIAEQDQPGAIAHTLWTQEDFLSMYRCFNCESTDTNLWFYQTMGIVEVSGHERGDVAVSMINRDSAHAKHGVYLDYVELRLRLE